MKCKQIIETIEAVYKREHAMEWDNVGLLVGDEEAQVHTILLALDATDEVIRQAAAMDAGLLITHHPLIFHGMKRIVADDFIGRRLLTLIRSDISCYAMHTNYDAGAMGRQAARRLSLEGTEILEVSGEMDGKLLGIGVKGNLPEALDLPELARQVKQKFELEDVRIFGETPHKIKRAAIVPGSGGSEIDLALKAGAEVLITGDIDHHEGMDAAARGLAVIDAGHFGLEHIFAEDMEQFLTERLHGEVEIRRAREAAPYVVL